MEKQTLIIAIIVISFIAGSCNKEDETEQLPPITQTGANTFGFVFDGVVFTPTDSNSRGFGIDGGGTSGLSVYGRLYGILSTILSRIEGNQVYRI